MESELELDAEIRDLQLLAAQPELFETFVGTGIVPKLVGLLTHENSGERGFVIDPLCDEPIAALCDSLLLRLCGLSPFRADIVVDTIDLLNELTGSDNFVDPEENPESLLDALVHALLLTAVASLCCV